MKTHFAYKPKIQELPRTLIYNKSKSSLYTMVTTQNPRIVGAMWASPRVIDKKKFFEIIFAFLYPLISLLSPTTLLKLKTSLKILLFLIKYYQVFHCLKYKDYLFSIVIYCK